MRQSGRNGSTGDTTKRLGIVAASVAVALATVFSVSSPAQAATAVKISGIYYNSPGNDTRSNTSLNAEYVNLQNLTRSTQVITNWTIRDVAGHVYKFPTTSIPAGRTITLRTGKGANSTTTRYWQQTNYIWNNDRDTAYLRNAAGASVYTCAYNSTAASYKSC
ncbi:MAG: hypothetical protein JWO98_1041 [Frankiales bacterium]|nr:hypothetical protein [Frankiales bacterium]